MQLDLDRGTARRHPHDAAPLGAGTGQGEQPVGRDGAGGTGVHGSQGSELVVEGLPAPVCGDDREQHRRGHAGTSDTWAATIRQPSANRTQVWVCLPSTVAPG